MANVTLLGVDYADVPAVELPKTGGGVATFYESIPWNYLGEDAEFIETIYTESGTKLKDTSFNGWTPSTTAKAIKSAQTLSSKAFTADFTQYEYLLRWRWAVPVVVNSGATMVKQLVNECAESWQWIGKRPNSLANISAQNFAGNACVTFFTPALLEYYDKNGAHTYTWSASYGLYASVTSCAFGSTTANSTTVTPKTPAWNARCSTTYFDTTRAPDVDQENTKLYMRGELWRLKKEGTVRRMYENLTDLYNDLTNP